jgi:hypothetical protein
MMGWAGLKPAGGLPRQIVNIAEADYILVFWVEAFLVDRKAQDLTSGSIRYYHQKIRLFTDYGEGQVITQIT